MSIAHGVAVEIVDEWKNCVHVFDFILQPLVKLPATYMLWHVLDLGCNVTHCRHEFLCVQHIPLDTVPNGECLLHQDNSIPKILESHQIFFAITQRSVV